MFICVCNKLTNECIREACNSASQPIDVFAQCGKSPRCCTCFTLIQQHIDNSPSKILSFNDLPDYLIEILKHIVVPSLSHIWRSTIEDGQLVFYKNDQRITLSKGQNQITIESDLDINNQDEIVQWFSQYTSILKGDTNEE